MAGCPKCTIDLIAANPQKSTIRYPNGFTTFKTLAVGEVLNLPDKWFDGTLDRMPRSYFESLPGVPELPQRSAYFPMQPHAKGWAGLADSRTAETEFDPDFGIGANPTVFNPCDQYSMRLTGGAGSTQPNFASWPTLNGAGGTGGPGCFGSGGTTSCSGVFTNPASIAIPTSFPDVDPSKPAWVVTSVTTTPAAAGVSTASNPPCAQQSQGPQGAQGDPCSSSNDCMWGLTCQGGTCQPSGGGGSAQTPTYTIPAGGTFTMILLPGLIVGGNYPGVDATAIARAKGLSVGQAQVQPDCSVKITGTNPTSSPISFSNLMTTPKGDAWVNFLVINNVPVVSVSPVLLTSFVGTLTRCHKFAMAFYFGGCANCQDPARTNPCRDPSAALKAAGFTKYTLLPSPDKDGRIYITGTWEGPTKSFSGSIGPLHIEDFKDLGTDVVCSGAINISQGNTSNLPCMTGYVKNAQGVCVLSTGGSGSGSGVQAPAASNTGTYVAVGAGVLLVGGGIALAMSSKKKRRR